MTDNKQNIMNKTEESTWDFEKFSEGFNVGELIDMTTKEFYDYAVSRKYCFKEGCEEDGRCQRQPMIGRSWWKRLGYHESCNCAYKDWADEKGGFPWCKCGKDDCPQLQTLCDRCKEKYPDAQIVGVGDHEIYGLEWNCICIDCYTAITIVV